MCIACVETSQPMQIVISLGIVEVRIFEGIYFFFFIPMTIVLRFSRRISVMLVTPRVDSIPAPRARRDVVCPRFLWRFLFCRFYFWPGTPYHLTWFGFRWFFVIHRVPVNQEMWTFVLGNVALYGRVANAFVGACCLGRSHTAFFLS